MTILRLVFIICLMTSYSLVVEGQQKVGSKTDPTSIEDLPGGCEFNNTVLDVLAQNTAADELVIAIARLGQDENRKNLNQRRLHNVKAFLTEILADASVKRKPETIILAEGDRVAGYGRVELYVKGKLYNVLKARPNADLYVGYCLHDPPAPPCPPVQRNIYPCRDKYPVNKRANK